ncbi:F0F1 ATP synthase subunit A [Seinonella peptonophila]|nr:F0F1 ATP synthase subunit A [Seinonella peptonophila]
MEKTPKIGFELGGVPIDFDLTVVITTTVTCLLVFLIVVLAARKLTMVPSGMQNLVEMVIDFTKGIVRSNLDLKTSSRFYGFAFTLFLFLLIANQLGLVFNLVTEHQQPIPFLGIEASNHAEVAGKEASKYAWWKSPTANLNVVFAMAIAITLMAHFIGIKRSPKNYLAHYFQPYPWMVILHLIDEVAKPVTHGMRLWANIFAGEVLIVIMLQASPLMTGLPLILWIGYSLFVGVVQAYVFTTLAFVYLSQKITTDH